MVSDRSGTNIKKGTRLVYQNKNKKQKSFMTWLNQTNGQERFIADGKSKMSQEAK